MADDQSIRIVFEPFAKLDLTKPFKLIPVGTWFRGRRKLDISRQRLEEVVKNFKAGLPQHKVGINLDHKDGVGKVGNVKDIAFLEDGPKGAGLYVTDFELSEKGEKAVEEDGYDAPSAEIVWSLNGATFQDPKSGEQVDNVLTGMALTPQPFFGEEVALYSTEPSDHHLGSPGAYMGFYAGAKNFDEYDDWAGAQEESSRLKRTDMIFRDLLDNIWYDEDSDVPEKVEAIQRLTREFQGRVQQGGEESMGILEQMRDLLTNLTGGATETTNTPAIDEEFVIEFVDEWPESEDFRDFTPKKRKALAASGQAMADGSFPIVNVEDLKNAIQAIGRAKNRSAAIKHIKKRASALGKSDLIPDNWTTDSTTDDKEDLAMADKEKDKDTPQSKDAPEDATEQLRAQNEAEKARADTAEAELDKLRSEQNIERLTAEAKAYASLPVEIEGYVEKMSALEGKDEDLAKWVRGQFESFDGVLKEAGLMREDGSDLEVDLSDTQRFEANVEGILKSEFKGDRSKYAEALAIASRKHPKLAEAYAVPA